CAIIREGQVVATESVFMPERRNDPSLLTLIGQRGEARERLVALDRIVEDVAMNTWAHIALSHVRDQLPRKLNEAYLPLALADAPFGQLDATISLMGDDGFFALLKYDRTLIEGLAALSICCSTLGPQEVVVSAFLKHRGLSLEQTLAAADELYLTH